MNVEDIYLILRIPLVLCLDAILGDPKWLVHPVVLIGHLVSGCEKMFRSIFAKTHRGERAAGICTVVVVCAVSFFVPAFILYMLFLFSRRCYIPHIAYLACAIDVFWGYQAVAARSLFNEAKGVYNSLSVSLEQARKNLSRIVGRETSNLDKSGVIRAAVETVSENTTDGVVSPLFFFAIGGAPLALLYKAVNTMDSMIGYMNEKYKYFGWCAAKLDDVFNFIPARISALCMIFSTAVCKPFSFFPVRYSPRNAFAVYKRDRKKHASPNSAQTESVCAGALGITLGGDAVYDGVTEHHQIIGNQIKGPDSIDIDRALILMYATSITATAFFMAVRFILAVVF